MSLTTKEQKSRVFWIDNLKLIAAILVMISHYAQLLARDSIVAPSYIVFLNRYPFALFTNGEFWVCVFCVLSGLLADKKIIRSFDELLLSYVTRYFRFLIPVGIANLYALIIYKIASAGEYHTGGFLDFARCTFVLDNSINPTLWVMRHILIGTLLIYTANYVISKMGGGK